MSKKKSAIELAKIVKIDQRPRFAFPEGAVAADVHSALNDILGSSAFRAAKKSSGLLRYCVEAALGGRFHTLSQKALSKAVFDVKDYQARVTSSNVRVEMQRVRQRLLEYYSGPGRDDRLKIGFPEKGYLPIIEWHYHLESPQAFLHFQKGRDLWAERTPGALAAAVSEFQEALALEPNYAGAHVAIAECYAFMLIYGAEPKSVIGELKKHVEVALSIAPDHPTGLAVLGLVRCVWDWDWNASEALLKRAIQINPHSMGARLWYSSVLSSLGSKEEAIRQCRMAQAGEPSLVVDSHVAKILSVLGEYGQAEELLLWLETKAPGFYLVQWQLGIVRFCTDRMDEAIERFTRARSLVGEHPSILTSLGCALAARNRREEASEILASLILRQQQEYIPACDIASLFGALGYLDEGFRWLDRASEEKSLFITWIKVWPFFEPFRRDARFARLLERVGLSEPVLCTAAVGSTG